jgi:hypothetical protein
MARNSHKILDLAEQIEALEPDDRLELLRLVVTPERELLLVAEDLQRKTRAVDPRVIVREVNRAVREVRSKRTANRATSRNQ